MPQNLKRFCDKQKLQIELQRAEIMDVKKVMLSAFIEQLNETVDRKKSLNASYKERTSKQFFSEVVLAFTFTDYNVRL